MGVGSREGTASSSSTVPEGEANAFDGEAAERCQIVTDGVERARVVDADDHHVEEHSHARETVAAHANRAGDAARMGVAARDIAGALPRIDVLRGNSPPAARGGCRCFFVPGPSEGMFSPFMLGPSRHRASLADTVALRAQARTLTDTVSRATRPKLPNRRRNGLAWTLSAFALAWATSDRASASPAVEGVRNLSLGGVARASSFGSNAALINPSNMSMEGVFTVDPMYQLGIQSRTHGLGAVAADSLLNPRVAVGMGYLFMKGSPRVSYFDTERMDRREFKLSSYGHEVFLAISVMPVKRWLAIALKGKYQYNSLRYRNSSGDARNAHDKLNAFGLDASVTVNFANWVALAVTGDNLTGHHPPAYTDDRTIRLSGLPVLAGTIDHGRLSELSGYPLMLAHGLSVFPLHTRALSINFDGTYDFTTYRFEKYTRLTYGGSAEFLAGPVPLRLGTVWDSRGRGKDDDRVFLSAGIGYFRPSKAGSVGLDIGFGFRQQVSGPQKETVLGINIGVRIQPDI